jgi:predicted RNA-binding Zn-ribbon protein involved in translation (DUF1610 family)
MKQRSTDTHGNNTDVWTHCPMCGEDSGMIFENEEGYRYEVPVHGFMGNASWRDDKVVSVVCDACGTIPFTINKRK